MGPDFTSGLLFDAARALPIAHAIRLDPDVLRADHGGRL
jgi:hypothetical protein